MPREALARYWVESEDHWHRLSLLCVDVFRVIVGKVLGLAVEKLGVRWGRMEDIQLPKPSMIPPANMVKSWAIKVNKSLN